MLCAGNGEFGAVFSGKIKTANGSASLCAVKTLKSGSDSGMKTKFLQVQSISA